MSKKTSPQSRPTRRPRTRGPHQVRAGGSSSARVNGRTPREVPEGAGGREAPAPVSFRGRLRRYLPTVLIPNVVGVLFVIVLALAVVLLASVEIAALPATIAQFWLILNLVPVSYDGTTIGMLPLVPAMGLVWLISRQINRAVRHRVSVADLGVLALCVLLVPLILTGIAAAMLWDASAVYAVAPPELFPALARVVVVHLVALVLGMGAKLWRALLRRYGLPPGLVDNTRTAARWFRFMSVAAVLVLVVALVASWNRQAELADLYNSAGALVALGVICLLYLPNALIGVLAVLVGAEFHIGETSVSLFSTHHTPLPPLPLTGAIPPESPVWFPVLLVVPAAVAGFLAYRGSPTLPSAAVTAVTGGVIFLVLGYLSQGVLGAFGQSGPMVLLGAGLVVVWLAASGVATALLLKLAARRQAAAAQEEPDEDTECGDAEDVADDTTDEDVDAVPEKPDEDAAEESTAADTEDYAEDVADDTADEDADAVPEEPDEDAAEESTAADTEDDAEAETAEASGEAETEGDTGEDSGGPVEQSAGENVRDEEMPDAGPGQESEGDTEGDVRGPGPLDSGR